MAIHDGGYDTAAAPWRKVFLLSRAQFRLWRLARRTRPDVLQAYLPPTNFLGALAARFAGVGLVQLIDIQPVHRSAELIVCIGEPEFRGRGQGTDALRRS